MSGKSMIHVTSEFAGYSPSKHSVNYQVNSALLLLIVYLLNTIYKAPLDASKTCSKSLHNNYLKPTGHHVVRSSPRKYSHKVAIRNAPTGL